MRIRSKLVLGFGAVTLGLLATGLVTYLQVGRIVDDTVALAENHVPQQEAILEMEINLHQLAQSVVDFSANAEASDLQRIIESEATFDRHAERWSQLATRKEDVQHAQLILEQFHELTALGREIVHISQIQHVTAPELHKRMIALDEQVDENLQRMLDSQSIAVDRVEAALELEININEAFAAINSYLHLPSPAHREVIADATKEFSTFRAQFQATSPDEEEAAWLVNIDNVFQETLTAAMHLMARADSLRDRRERFKGQLRETEWQLDNVLQPLVEQSIQEAETNVKRSAGQITVFIALTSLFGTSFAAITGVVLLREITTPLGRLAHAADAIGKGDFGTRIDIRSSDEIGSLADSINEMSARLEDTTISRTYLDGILGSLAESIVVIDTEGIICKVNNAALDITGFSEQEIVGGPATLILHDDLVYRVWQAGSQHPTVIKHAEGLIKDKNGNELPVLFSATVMYRPDGRTHWIVVSCLDFSEQKRAREDLAISEQRAKDIADSASDWFWETDANDKFIYISEKFFDWAQVDPATRIGHTRRSFISREELDNFPDKWRLHFDDLANHRPFRDLEYAIVGNDGRRRYIKVSGVPIFDTTNNLQGYRGAITDVTERKLVELELAEHRANLELMVEERTAELRDQTQRLEEALEKAHEYNRLQRQLVSMASHEFRTPLAIIDASAQRMLRHKGELTEERLVKTGAKIRGAVVRMTGLIESTLSAARLDAGTIECNPRLCDLTEVVQDVCARQAGISNEFDISVDLSGLSNTSVYADPKLLDQVFTNLLSNAVKYSPGKTSIEVCGSIVGDRACVSVRDHGLGIPASELPRMFTAFFRAKTSTGIAGTGIGLNIVKQLLDMHRGEITVDSIEGEGSVFSVWLYLDFRTHSREISMEATPSTTDVAPSEDNKAAWPHANKAEFG